MGNLSSTDQFIAIALALGLVISLAYIFIFWSRIEKNFRQYLQKKYAVKLVNDGHYPYYENTPPDILVKGKVSKIKKWFIKFQYYLLTVILAFWPLAIWVAIIFYFQEELRPILQTKF